MTVNTIIALVPIVVIAWYYYGLRVLIICAISVATCLICDTVCLVLQKKPIRGNYSAFITGLIIALLMPASVPYYVVVAAAVIAIFVAKQPFGGFGNNIFNPACAGFSFVLVCWPDKLMKYPEPSSPINQTLNIASEYVGNLVNGPLSSLKESSLPLSWVKNGTIPSDKLWEILTGHFPGAMGVTCVILLCGCAVYLLITQTISWHIPVSFLLTASAFNLILPRIENVSDVAGGGATAMTGVFLEIVVGSMLFSMIFVATDPVTTPSFPLAKIIFGLGCGLLTMTFRYFGKFPEGITFSILIMNSLSGVLDHIVLKYKAGDGVIKTVKERISLYRQSEEYSKGLEEMELFKKQREEEKRVIREEKAFKKAEKRAAEARRQEELARQRLEEARRMAELKSRQEAEAQAKAKAEEEAKALAEAQAKARAAEEAKALAEARAKAKTEEEAKALAEAQAKAKAEEEAPKQEHFEFVYEKYDQPEPEDSDRTVNVFEETKGWQAFREEIRPKEETAEEIDLHFQNLLDKFGVGLSDSSFVPRDDPVAKISVEDVQYKYSSVKPKAPEPQQDEADEDDEDEKTFVPTVRRRKGGNSGWGAETPRRGRGSSYNTSKGDD
jgi:electron transport complex protein RnfD